ncbi:MAG TPA: glycosyltransferase family 39 protein [Chloroflexota bacterium]|nr:glycosyltransferase family 39 protein [Chloroflexota bacterium]
MSGYCSIAVLLLAFGLRVYHLDFQASLSDDALGLTLARHNPLSLFSITSSEPFPPTFYVVLSVWTRLAGDSEFAGRFLSVLFSMLAVAVLFATGRALVGQPGGLIAAFLLAVDPFDIFFAQEVRMYTMVVLFSLVSAYLAYNLLLQRHERWLLYALASIAAAMTHAFALLVLFGQDVAALASGPRGWRWLRSWAACQLAVAAVFAVWVLLVAGRLRQYNNALVTSGPLPAIFWKTVNVFTLGFGQARGLGQALPVLVLLLAALGLLWLTRGQRSQALHALVFLLSWLAVPFIAVWAISLVRPIFYERYMAVALPPLLIAAAAGVVALQRGLARSSRAPRVALAGLAGAALLLIAVGSGTQLRDYYGTIVYARAAQMRALAHYVDSVRHPLVLVNTPADDPLYGYYLPPSTDVRSTLNVSSTPALQQAAAGHPTIWLLPFGHSTHQDQALSWLNAHAFPAESRWFDHAQVLGFSSAFGSDARLPVPADTHFGPAIQLVSASANTTVRAGDPVDVTLLWRCTARPTTNESVFVHLLDTAGQSYAQHDGWPAAGTKPTSIWQPGQTITDRHGLLTDTALPAGTYRLEVGLYNASGTRLRLPNGATSAIIGSVHVSK